MLFAIGIACLAWYGVTLSVIHRTQAGRLVDAELMLTKGEADGRLALPSADPQLAGLVGVLNIPRLHVSAVVLEGDDESVLESAVGYLPDTPPPWQPGNTAVAAHRDRLFRPLQGIRVGDDIRLITRHGEFAYRVRRALIVSPGDVWVLDPLAHVNLTLITCFPFVYVGPAPRRFVVEAEKIEPKIL
jgi:sortase A